MKRSLLPPKKPGLPDLCQCNLIRLEGTSSNICKNEWAGPTPSGHTHYLNMVFKIHLVTFEQWAWHEGVVPTLLFSHILWKMSRRVCLPILEYQLQKMEQLWPSNQKLSNRCMILYVRHCIIQWNDLWIVTNPVTSLSFE